MSSRLALLLPTGLAAFVALAAALQGPRLGAALLLLPILAAWLPPTGPRLRARGSAAGLAMMPVIFVLFDVLFGAPSTARLALAALLGIALVIVLPAKSPRLLQRGGWPIPLLAIALLWTVWSFVALRPIQHGVDLRLGQDTAYFTQLLARAAAGEAPRGDVVTAVLYHPPLRSHFGAHISPVIYLLAPAFWIAPGWKTLALLRSLALLLSAGVTLAWVRRGGASVSPALVLVLALSMPSFVVQPMHAVYLLPFAVPAALLFWAGIESKQRLWTWLGLLALLLVREDATLMACTGGALYLALGPRRWRAAALWAVIGIGWYGLCTAVLMPRFGNASGEAIAGLFDEVGGPAGVLRHPGFVFSQLFDRIALWNVWALVRATGGLALLSPVTLVGLPAHAINALVAGQGFGTLELDYHYALLPALACVAGAFAALTHRLEDDGQLRLPGFGRVPLHAILLLWLGGAAITALDAVDRERVRALSAPPHQAWLEQTVEQLPRSWEIAAPRPVLPLLALQRELYMANMLAEYPAPRPDAWLMSTDIDGLRMRDGTEPAYRALLLELDQRTDVRVVGESAPWRLYLRADRAWPPEGSP